MRLTTDPSSPAASSSATIFSEPHTLVPVDAPTRRPSSRRTTLAPATDAASGTRCTRSTTSGMNEASTLGRPMPSMSPSDEGARNERSCCSHESA